MIIVITRDVGFILVVGLLNGLCCCGCGCCVMGDFPGLCVSIWWLTGWVPVWFALFWGWQLC